MTADDDVIPVLSGERGGVTRPSPPPSLVITLRLQHRPHLAWDARSEADEARLGLWLTRSDALPRLAHDLEPPRSSQGRGGSGMRSTSTGSTCARLTAAELARLDAWGDDPEGMLRSAAAQAERIAWAPSGRPSSSRATCRRAGPCSGAIRCRPGNSMAWRSAERSVEPTCRRPTTTSRLRPTCSTPSPRVVRSCSPAIGAREPRRLRATPPPLASQIRRPKQRTRLLALAARATRRTPKGHRG